MSILQRERIDYRLIRSSRKTISLEITPGLEIIVRAPLKMSIRRIDRFVSERADWIETHLEKMRRKTENTPSIAPATEAERALLMKQAKEVIPQRAAYFAPIVGVTYGRITIRQQKTRWGSCSAAGNLNFNCLLMKMPPKVLDYVVVHELCHRLEMNHSPAFWAEVERVLPDYRQRRSMLKNVRF